MGADTLAYGTLVGGVLLVSGWSPRMEDRARNLVLRSLEGQFQFNVTAVVQQCRPGSGNTQTVKVVRDKQGRVCKFLFGSDGSVETTCIDNGQTVFIQISDTGAVFRQDSERAHKNLSFSTRAKLADNNYDFRVLETDYVAGRKALKIGAFPRVPDKSVRFYSIDAQTGFPLGLEIREPKGKHLSLMVTKEIKFPKSVSQSFFEVRPMGAPMPSVVQCSRPVAMRSVDQARKSLGFAPIIPPQMPMGFVVDELQVFNSPDWKRCTLRLSDGLVRATVYQWRNDDSKPKLKNLAGYTLGEANGIHVMVVSEANATVRKRLLDAFIRGADSLEMPCVWFANWDFNEFGEFRVDFR